MRVPIIGTALLLFIVMAVAGCSFGVARATAPEPDAPPPEQPEPPAPEAPPEPPPKPKPEPEQPEPAGPETDTIPVLSGDVPDQIYTVGVPIMPLVLPDATGGEGELRYSLEPLPPGLEFDDVWRELSGTPTEAGEWEVVYRVDDGDANTADSDAAITRFTITVDAPPPPPEPTEPDEPEEPAEPPNEPDEPAEPEDEEPSNPPPAPPSAPAEPETPSGLMTEAECREAWGGRASDGEEGSVCGCGCNPDGCTFTTLQYRKDERVWITDPVSGSRVQVTRSVPCSEGESGCRLICAV